ncbi:MAG: response regulator transcription factor [Leptolyngbyaceae cyanobacterium CSU_1_3]|nr:response regulator transcription factor [Leptolyngbyaceae cyanobacterium CSU_1_3]
MKLLLVEDDQDITELLAEALSSENYAIDVALDGQAGWESVTACDYDLLLLDVFLPKEDGISLCRRLRSHGYRMPILMLTARDTLQDWKAGIDAGASGYLVKPYKLRELLKSIQALLDQSPLEKSPLVC